MMDPTRDTILEALRIVRAGGADGPTLAEFARKWPSTLGAGVERRTLSGVGKVTGYLVRHGLLQRAGRRSMARFTLTPAGERFLADAAPQRGRQ
jgi:hypothetical protein